MSKKVSYVRFHQAPYIQGTGDMGNTLPAPQKHLNDLDMSFDELGLTLNYSYQNIKYQVLIPSANVVSMRLVEELKVVKPSKSA